MVKNPVKYKKSFYFYTRFNNINFFETTVFMVLFFKFAKELYING